MELYEPLKLEIGTDHKSQADWGGQYSAHFAQIVREPVTDYRVEARVHKRTSTTLQIETFELLDGGEKTVSTVRIVETRNLMDERMVHVC
jgi:hypothetical protein